MSKPMRICAACGVTSETKIIKYVSQAGGYYCMKHKAQIYRYGHVLDNEKRTTADPNEIVVHENYAEIIIRNNTQKIVASALIDIEDIEKCSGIKWYLDDKGYVEGPKKLKIHRYILNYDGDLVIDHINRNKLDNRKQNLRIVSVSENNQNNGKQGISLQQKTGKWKAEFQKYGKSFYIGSFETKEEAIDARNAAITEIESQSEKLRMEYMQRDSDHKTGVHPSPHGRWIAKFCVDGKVFHVGTFNTQEEAVAARQNAILHYRQEKKTA